MPVMFSRTLTLVATVLIMTVVYLEIQKWENSFPNYNVHLPEPDSLKGSSISEKVPYSLIGDEAFPLQSWLLHPYPGQGIPEEQEIFNYRLSKERSYRTPLEFYQYVGGSSLDQFIVL